MGRELRAVQERLFALGCTRFSLATEEAFGARDPWRLPPFLGAQSERAVVVTEAPSQTLRERMARSPWGIACVLDGAPEAPAEADALATAAGARVLAHAELASGHATVFARKSG